MTWPSIGDYALIGNCRTAALVCRDGSLEWLCLPTFSSPSLFGAVLDRRAGHFSIRPRGKFTSERRYLSRSNVLETTFRCEGGAVLRLTDCMPLPAGPSGEMKTDRELDPQHEVLRRMDCTAGEVEVEIEFAPRPRYGARRTGFRDCGKLGWQLSGCPFGAFLQTDVPLRGDGHGTLRGAANLRTGDVRWSSLAYDEAEASVLPPLGNWAQRRLDDTTGWWRWWTGRCRYEGEYGEQVLRSALALKMLASATSGAVLAAPTTSLPEALGGERNWDYRFCWIRDSALVLHAFLSLGFVEEGEGFLGWLLHATRLTWPRLQVMYDLYGETHLQERTLPHLSGYRGSRPVRIGNAAHEQLQLDIYGELIATVAQYVDSGGELDSTERRMVQGLGRSVCQLWRQPDQGIWETRGPARHHTYSKGMCWVALDRLLHLGLGDEQVEHERGAVRDEIEKQGFNERLGAYVGYYGGEEPDAALLLLGRHGYQPPDHPRMQGTWRFIRERLSRDGLLQRYPLDSGYDGVKGGENAFAPCTFWAAEYLANLGRRNEAREIFERLLGCANDVGLYAEEIVPGSGEPIGNFPQAFTHVSMISAATALTVKSTA